MKVLVIYDGTLQGKGSLLYGARRVHTAGGELTVLHTFDPSMFIGYDAVPGAVDMARREAAGHLSEAKRIVSEQIPGVPVLFVSAEGNCTEMARLHAAREHPDLVIAPQRYKELSRSSSSPVLFVPGIILVPVDPSGAAADIETIAAEAAAMHGSVQLAGIVPLHLYSREERDELERVRRNTAAAVKRIKDELSGRGITVADEVRAGYPDEEILRAADEHGASLLLLPSGGTIPSELSKAAAILQDEPERVRWPIIILPATQGA